MTTGDDLEHLASLAASVCLDEVGSDEFPSVVRSFRSLERAVAAIGVGLASRAATLAGAGEIDEPATALLAGGEVSSVDARRTARMAEICATMPAVGRALDQGWVGAESVDAIARAHRDLVTDEQREAFEAVEHDLVADAARLPVDTFRRRIRHFVDDLRTDWGDADEHHLRADAELRFWTDRHGRRHLSAHADPARMAEIEEQVQAEARSLAAAGDVELGRNLDFVALHALTLRGSAILTPGRASRPSVTIVHDVSSGRTETVGGAPVRSSTLARLSCDADVHHLLLDGGEPLRYGRGRRTASQSQRRALEALYRTCAWADCDRPVRWCQAHHVHEWVGDLGPSDIENLLPLCSHHHHQAHEGGWRLELDADRTLRIFRPDGRLAATARPDRFTDPPGIPRPERDGAGRQRGDPPPPTGSGREPDAA